MANSSQSIKRVRQANKARLHNASLRSLTRTVLKQMSALIAAGDQGNAKAHYVKMSSVLDKMTNKGIIQKNKAARHKRRFNAHIKNMA